VVQQHACRRLRWWLRRKHDQAGGNQGYSDMKLYEEYGLVNLTRCIRCLPLWAWARDLVGEPGAGNSQARFDERGVETVLRANYAGKTPKVWDSESGYTAHPRDSSTLLMQGETKSGAYIAKYGARGTDDSTRSSAYCLFTNRHIQALLDKHRIRVLGEAMVTVADLASWSRVKACGLTRPRTYVDWGLDSSALTRWKGRWGLARTLSTCEPADFSLANAPFQPTSGSLGSVVAISVIARFSLEPLANQPILGVGERLRLTQVTR
jgi:hypothetical protein